MITTKRIADSVLVQDRLLRHFVIPMAKQGSCLHCGRSRSSRARDMPQDSAPHKLICSRRACAEARSLLRRFSSVSATAGTMVVEIHHYHHVDQAAGNMHMARCISEAQAQSPHKSWTKLPGKVYTSRLASQGHGRLPTTHEEPPYVDASSKPSEDAVRVALRRRGQ
ncbi:hypothetical protein SVAN01_11656 [Stagonosporopsis vannaccii]|nr:hypothetical protein SVAN01_11656 [Stagonosporopsis vannaccii]